MLLDINYSENQEKDSMDKKLTSLMSIVIIFILLISTANALTALSISSAGFSSNDKDLEGQAWLVTFALKGDQSFSGTIKANDIKTNDGKRALNDLSISAEAVKNSCNYDIKLSGDPSIVDYGTSKESVYGNQIASKTSVCLNSNKNNFAFFVKKFYVGGIVATADFYCISKGTIGEVATIQTPIENFEANLKVSIKGKESSAKINSVDSSSVNIPPVAYATWVGSFTSGERCPEISAQGYNVINTKDSKFYISKQYIYNDYRARLNQLNDAENRLASKFVTNGLTIQDQSLIDSYIQQVNEIHLKIKDFETQFGYQTPSSKAVVDTTNGKINLELTKALSTPVITMKVDADVLGVYIPVGKPQIVSLESVPFQEGLNGYITATIKNIGDVSSTFEVGTTCDTPFSPSTTVLTSSLLSPNQQTSIKIPITAQTEDNSENSVCTVSVYDADKPQEKVTKTVKVTVTCSQLCSSGSTRCNGANKERCTGCKWEDLGESSDCKNLCALDIDCNDGSECTIDKCIKSMCSYTEKSDCKLPPPLPKVEICDNLKDDDGDKKIDKKDPDCQTECNQFRNTLLGFPILPAFLDIDFTQCRMQNSPLFWLYTGGIGIIVAGFVFLMLRAKFKKENAVNTILSLVIGALASLLFYYFALIAIYTAILIVLIGFIVWLKF